jgi:hypothetical protein
MATQTNNSGGIGFFGLLGLVFITLKLLGVVDWSWWLVLSPLWGPLVLILAITIGVYAYFELKK